MALCPSPLTCTHMPEKTDTWIRNKIFEKLDPEGKKNFDHTRKQTSNRHGNLWKHKNHKISVFQAKHL